VLYLIAAELSVFVTTATSPFKFWAFFGKTAETGRFFTEWELDKSLVLREAPKSRALLWISDISLHGFPRGLRETRSLEFGVKNEPHNTLNFAKPEDLTTEIQKAAGIRRNN
jgi:hypothetical protein